MTYFWIIFFCIDWLLFVPVALTTLYLFVFAVASLFSHQRELPVAKHLNRIIVLIPSCKKDESILLAVNSILGQSYPQRMFDVTVISDNMPAYTMKTKGIDLFTSAADVTTCDGYIVNKVGTFQIALACRYYGVPYIAAGNPNPAHPSIDSVVIEERDPELTLHAMDIKLTKPGVKGYYPAFDVTPPEFVTAIATDKGLFRPADLHRYFEL